MTALEWVRRLVGATISYPGGVGGQCVDACNSYLAQVWDAAPVRANARDWPEAHRLDLMWVPNTPINYPERGCIVIWRGPVPVLGIGPEGHCAVVLAADSRVLLTADQNWSGQRYLGVWVHGYDGVNGWLVPGMPLKRPPTPSPRPGAHRGGKVPSGGS